MAAGERTVQYTKRGLKVVGPKSIFDLDEPPWVPDDKVHNCLNCKGEFTIMKRKVRKYPSRLIHVTIYWKTAPL